MEIKTPERPLNTDQYYPGEFEKKFIFLHHTVNNSVQGTIDWWNTNPDHVATAFIIGRDGSLYEVFPRKDWSYALGVKGATDVEKRSVQIELISWGPVIPKNKEYFTVVGNIKIPQDEVAVIQPRFRGFCCYQKYTPEQITTLQGLLRELMLEFGIKKQPNIRNFWMFEKSYGSYQHLPSGIWAHSTVRIDKSDIMPQEELTNMIYSL